MSDTNFKKFLDDARKNALEVNSHSHTAEEAKVAIKDLLEISYQVEKLLGERLESGADARLLQKRYEALKKESRESEKKLTHVREAISSEVLTIIREMAADVQILIDDEKNGQVKPAGAIGTRLKQNLKRLAEVLTGF